jgi:hypothetical protein
MASKTSVRKFQYAKDEFFEIVRAWALSFDFEIKEKKDDFRLYHKNGFGAGVHGWLLAQHDGKVAHIEAWLGPRDEQKKSLFFNGEKMSLENSFSAGLPRAQYREIFNKLLDAFEEPRI